MTNELEPTARSGVRPPRRWWALVASAAALSLLASVGTVVVSAAVAPTVAGAATCAPTQPGKVAYTTIATPAPTRPTALIVISRVTISNLNSGCNGRTAKLVFEGNTTGDPSGPKTTLSTVTSTKKCTGAALGSPNKIAKGSITFTLCPTPATRGRYVHVHDLTFLTFSIAGTTTHITTPTSPTNTPGTTTPTPTTTSTTVITNPTKGTGGSGGGTGVSTSSSSTTGGSLAFTGAEIAAMVTGGLIIILLGLFLLLLARRRRDEATGDGTS